MKGVNDDPVFSDKKMRNSCAMADLEASRNQLYAVVSKINFDSEINKMCYMEDIQKLTKVSQQDFQNAARCQAAQWAKTSCKISSAVRPVITGDFMFEEAPPSEWALWMTPERAQRSRSRWVARCEVFSSGAMAEVTNCHSSASMEVYSSYIEPAMVVMDSSYIEPATVGMEVLSGGSFTMGSCAMDGEEGSSTTDFQFGDAPSAAWTAMQKSRAEL